MPQKETGTNLYAWNKEFRNTNAETADHVSDKGDNAPVNTPFRIRLSNFSYVHKEKKKGRGRMLRFNLTWIYDCEYGRLAQDLEGCLARLTKGKLVWSPPLFRSGQYYKNNLFFSDDFDKLLISTLSKTKFVEHLVEAETAFLESKDPKQFDPNLPDEVNI